MNGLKEQLERSVGDRFIEWLNAERRSFYSFSHRADPGPDLVYAWEGRKLNLEVTGAYYDSDHAKFLWESARGIEDAPTDWIGTEPDASLAASVITCIEEKSKKRYGKRTLLLINTPPGVTSAEELEAQLQARNIRDNFFEGIYVVGRFPITMHSSGGYRVLSLKAFPCE
ncbi:MAG: hypothetical protein Q4G39_04100 [Brachymonas sp.]|nr:hypothetical protein [Brachymonas sp.]